MSDYEKRLYDNRIEEITRLRDEVERLKKIIADNCDPGDATVEDGKLISKCYRECYPENFNSEEE